MTTPRDMMIAQNRIAAGGSPRFPRRQRSLHRGFTLVELLVAGVITAFILATVGMSLSQLGRARDSSKTRFDAFLRADAILELMRRDVASIVRADDLFFTRLLLIDDTVHAGNEEFDRDELLLFNNRLKPLWNIDFNGEGFEYETQFRIIEDDYGPVLWQRRDPFPDEYPQAGGIGTPAVEGALSLLIQAYDGEVWYDEWDSDIHGLPEAISIAVVTSGHRDGQDIYDAPRAVLRTVIAIDRVIQPKDLFEEEEEPTEEGQDLNGDGIPDTTPPDDTGGTTPPPTGGRPGGDGGPRPAPPPGGGGRPRDAGSGGRGGQLSSATFISAMREGAAA